MTDAGDEAAKTSDRLPAWAEAVHRAASSGRSHAYGHTADVTAAQDPPM